MRIQPKPSIPVAAFATGLCLLLAGCGNPPETPVVSAATTTVGMELDDSVVTAKVKSALLADPDIKSFDLNVETLKGTVQLSGFVDNQAQIDRAYATTQAVEGVKLVQNNVTLKAGETTIGNSVDDDVITTRIKAALLADPGIKSLDIAVVTRKGAVQLSGFVDSQPQIDQALAIARGVEGVASVDDEMTLKQ
jgi:hyperosmotically inducible periplasmic protein